MRVSAALELDGGQWLRWLRETLWVDLYLSMFYDFICKISEKSFYPDLSFSIHVLLVT
jgi:hypothetical protein